MPLTCRNLLLIALVQCLPIGCPRPADAIEITLDYTLDEQNWNWFSSTPEGLQRRAAMDAAAGFLSAILQDDDWAAVSIDVSTVRLTDLFQSSILGLDGTTLSGTPESDGVGFAYDIPLTNRSVVGANEVVIYVSAFAFDTGTSGHANASPSGSARRNTAGLNGEAFNTWGGDIQFDLSDSWYAGQNPGIDPTDKYGYQDPDKTPSFDTPNDDWDFSTSSFTWKGFDLEKQDPAANGRLDLYASAMHELLHALGATSSNLAEYVGIDSEGRLDGQNVVATYGGPIPRTGGHFAENTEGIIWGSDGIVSEALLDPNSLRGRRKYLTELDAALLRDLGYDVATTFFEVTLAGDYNNDNLVNAADYTVWRDELGTTFIESDYEVWISNYGATAVTPANTVPEPTTALLSLISITVGLWTRCQVASRSTKLSLNIDQHSPIDSAVASPCLRTELSQNATACRVRAGQGP